MLRDSQSVAKQNGGQRIKARGVEPIHGQFVILGLGRRQLFRRLEKLGISLKEEKRRLADRSRRRPTDTR